MTLLGAVDWHQVKLFAAHSTGISLEALLVIAAVVVQLLVASLTRGSLARPLPLLAALAVVLLNEANDLRVESWPDRGAQLGEAVKDVVLTIAVPLLIFLVARHRPRLLVQGSN